MLFLVQSSDGHDNGELILNTDTEQLESLSVRREREKDNIHWLIRIITTNGKAVEVHDTDEVARRRVKEMLIAFGASESEAGEIVSKLRFDFQ